MEQLEIDHREKEDIIKQIYEKAISYTPEWRFDEEHPDIGTALALVYADLFSNTVKRLNKVPMKNRISFFNCLGASLLPAIPASGYVQFSLVNNQVEGSQVESGTRVIADSKEGNIFYETLDDIYVTPSELTCLYQTFDKEDQIYHLYEKGEKREERLVFFSLQGKNLQEHIWYFSNDTLLSIEKSTWIGITCYQNKRQEPCEEFLAILANQTITNFEYYSEEGFIPFENQKKQGQTLLFLKGGKQPAFQKTELMGTEHYWIRCSINNIQSVKKFGIDDFLIQTSATGIEADYIYGDGIECNPNEYLPFGETLDLYKEVYFGCKEALSKQGAYIDFSYYIHFAKIPLDFNEKDEIMWKWIMKSSDFKPDLDYDIMIESVIWEYYNGNGWARLFITDQYKQAFSAKENKLARFQTISFVCPSDMKLILIGAKESYYIRARIIKVNNLYKMTGHYISPILEHTSFQYHYKTAVPIEHIITKNNLETKYYNKTIFSLNQNIWPFYSTSYENLAIYMGFKIAPIGAPIKILFILQEIQNQSAGLVWEYYSNGKWISISMIDETKNLSKTGIVTMLGSKEMTKGSFFGRELYWIRILDYTNYYGSKEQKNRLPCITGIYINTTKIKNVDYREIEKFRMELYEESIKFLLMRNHIFWIEVFIDETDTLSEIELEKLKKQNRILIEENKIWVKWEQVEDFMDSAPMDRHYIIHSTEGELLFGDGRKGKIPSISKTDNILVQYLAGGGIKSNVSEDAIQKLSHSIGFINKVRNPQKLLGGCDIESVEDALYRNAAMIRHQFRAVTTKDFEELAKLASRDIQTVTCFANLDENGKRTDGAVTLVILQKNYLDSNIEFHKIKQDIYEYMKDKINENLIINHRFFIRQPIFVRICIRAEVAVANFNVIFQVKKELETKLTDYFNPITGQNKKGFPIGTIPNHIQIQNVISETKGIIYLKKMFLTTFINDINGWKEVSLEGIEHNPYILPVSGEHEILITVE